MKRHILAVVLATAAGSATANNPFDFQRQFGSEEYVHGADARHMTFAPVEQSDFVPSLAATMLAADVDGIAPHHVTGDIVPYGPSRISLWEVQRGSPEGIAYRDYHARYPADTDWDRITREYRENRMHEGLASETRDDDGRS